MFFQRLSRYKDEDGLLPSNEYMSACRGVHHTYSICLHACILIHTLNVCIQSLEYHNTLSLKYIYMYIHVYFM